MSDAARTPLPAVNAVSAKLSSRSLALGAAAERIPPQGYFVGSAIFRYLGPAFAVLLFALVTPLGVAWMRVASAGVVVALWRKPWRSLSALDPNTRRLLIGLGVVLAVMNSCFYIAIDRLPLGTVAAIEFLPVILLAASAFVRSETRSHSRWPCRASTC
jgi:inner membrane transporter RhtA